MTDSENFNHVTGNFPHYWLPNREADRLSDVVAVVPLHDDSKTTNLGHWDTSSWQLLLAERIAYVVTSFAQCVVAIVSGPSGLPLADAEEKTEVADLVAAAAVSVEVDDRVAARCEYVKVIHIPPPNGGGGAYSTNVLGLLLCNSSTHTVNATLTSLRLGLSHVCLLYTSPSPRDRG